VTEILASPCQCPAAAALDRVLAVLHHLAGRTYQPSFAIAEREALAAIEQTEETPA
jgi:hypothetical protein